MRSYWKCLFNTHNLSVQFGKPIFEQQIIQHYLADMALEIETLRSMTYRVAWMVDQGMKVH